MKRIVLDTNVFVGGAYNADSASRELVQACWQGRLTLVVSRAIRREYEKILPRAIRDSDQRQWAAAVIERAEMVEIEDPPPRVVEGDPEDDKFIATAVAGRADALISNDQQVLQVGTHQGIRVLRPVEAVR